MELLPDQATMMDDSENDSGATDSQAVKEEPAMGDKNSMPSSKNKVRTKDELLYKEELHINWDESDNTGTINGNSACPEQNCIMLKDEQGQVVDILQPTSDLTACPNCYKILTSAETFESHLKVCEKHNYACDKCPFVTWNRFDLKSHKHKHDETESPKRPRMSGKEKNRSKVDFYSCTKCSYICNQLSMLKSHNKLHSTASKSVRRKKTISRPKNASDVANQGIALVSAKSLYAKVYDNVAEQNNIANSSPLKVQSNAVEQNTINALPFKDCNQDYNEMKEITAEIMKQQVKVTKTCRVCNITTEFDFGNTCKMCDRKCIFQCSKCSRTFENYLEVSYHLWTSCNIEGYHQCLKCDFRSPFKSKVRVHCDKHHPEICDPLASVDEVKYIEYRALNSNAQEVGSPATKCAICDKEFEQLVELENHLNDCQKIQQIVEIVKWNVNASQNPSTSILETSNSTLPEYIVQYCVKCNKDSKLESFMLRRLKPCKDCNNSTMFYKCSKCRNLCKSYYDACKHDDAACLRSKTGDHNPKKSNVGISGGLASMQSYCTNCCLRSSVALREENCRKCKRTLHFSCQICRKTLVKGDDDKACEHIKKFLATLKFECRRCAKGFLTKEELDKHMNSCNATPLPHKCQFCDFLSTAKMNVERHERQAHPRQKKIFQCNVCSLEYADDIDDLKRHILKRHVRGKNVPPCTRCGWDLKGSLGLEKHLAYCGKKLYMQCRVNLTRLKVERAVE